ncbi:hypothetical protein BV898_04984 [Hypsibius exemplaris]|uniref:RxLR effector protein n=1 Tax=Hypsibius exemplaris TaxID=2072580 RepID=A0A1W0X0C0_HYPEX|nr:hypothetical protein BV898_04984 [Hypsibius exemplaris]
MAFPVAVSTLRCAILLVMCTYLVQAAVIAAQPSDDTESSSVKVNQAVQHLTPAEYVSLTRLLKGNAIANVKRNYDDFIDGGTEYLGKRSWPWNEAHELRFRKRMMDANEFLG